MKYSVEDLRQALFRITDALIEAKDLLTDIDNISGDGDLGISMEKGATTIRRELELPDEASQENCISDLLMRCSSMLNKEAPSTMGTLTSLAIADVARMMQGKSFFEDKDILQIPQSMAQTIMIYGRAQVGDKTVLDALLPLFEALTDRYQSSGGNLDLAVTFACEETFRAVNGTKGWIARIGRAKWFANRSKNCQDGGATVYAIAVSAMCGCQYRTMLDHYRKNYYVFEPEFARLQP